MTAHTPVNTPVNTSVPQPDTRPDTASVTRPDTQPNGTRAPRPVPRRVRSRRRLGDPDSSATRKRSARVPKVPKGVPRWRRIGRALWRSPLLRFVLAAAVAMQVRGAYLRLDTQRAAWGKSVLAPVASRARATGDILRADDLRWTRLPRAAVPLGTPTSRSAVIGRRLLAPVGVGEVIASTRLATLRTSALRSRTGTGRVAVAIVTKDVDPVVVLGDVVDIVDSSGQRVAINAEVVKVQENQVTVSIVTDQLSQLAVAVGGPVTIALIGADGTPSPVAPSRD